MMVPRYSFDEKYNAGAGIVEDPQGKYVKVEDVLELINEKCEKCPHKNKET
jgi:hypothetical protein